MIGSQRKKTILDSAETVFARHGFLSSSVSMIVSHSKIARGTFYSYFSGKKEVFYALVEDFFSSIDKVIYHIDMSSKDTPLYQIQRNIENLASLFYKRRKLTKIIFTYARGIDSESDARIDLFYKSAVVLIENAIIEGVSLKIIRACNTQIASLCILGCIKELAMHIVNNNIASSKERKEVAHGLIDFALQGILATNV